NEVQAKLCKALAYTLRLSKQPEDKSRALELLQRALLLHSKSGVKRDIELLQRELKKADDSKQDAAPEPEKKPAKNTGTKPKPGSAKKTATARKKAAS
ncbi:terminase, partial [Morganella morganii]